MRAKARKQLFEDVIKVPVKEIGTELVLFSEEFAPFEDTSPDSFSYHVYADDELKKSGITLDFEVSYDNGKSWLVTSTNGFDEVEDTSIFIDAKIVAPRLRVKATIASEKEIYEDTIFGIDVEMRENKSLSKFKSFEIQESSEALTGNSSTTVFSVPDSVVEKIIIAAQISKSSPLIYFMVSSFDGHSWWADPAMRDTEFDYSFTTEKELDFKEAEFTQYLGNYFKLICPSSGNPLLGIKVYALVYYN